MRVLKIILGDLCKLILTLVLLIAILAVFLGLIYILGVVFVYITAKIAAYFAVSLNFVTVVTMTSIIVTGLLICGSFELSDYIRKIKVRLKNKEVNS